MRKWEKGKELRAWRIAQKTKVGNEGRSGKQIEVGSRNAEVGKRAKSIEHGAEGRRQKCEKKMEVRSRNTEKKTEDRVSGIREWKPED